MMTDLLCRLLGHRNKSRVNGGYYDRRHVWRERYHTQCTRCGAEPPECWFPGLVERRHELWRSLRAWLRADCIDCKKPEIRFGRPVGDHEKCDPIPF